MAKTHTIEVDDYYDEIHQNSWARRTASYLGGATMGVGYGVIIGTVAAFIPYVLGVAGAAPGLLEIGTSIVNFASTLGLMGITSTAVVGAGAGALARGLAEKEKREKLEQLQEDSPSQTIAGADLKIKPVHKKSPPLYNWRSAIFVAPLLAAFGALLALNPLTASFATLMGFTAGSTAAVIGSAMVGAMFGALCLSTKNSYLTNKLSNFYVKMLSGELISGVPEKEPAFEAPQRVAKSEENTFGEPKRASNFASEKLRFSLQDMIEKTGDKNVSSEMQVNR